jgi:hypothetical protein
MLYGTYGRHGSAVLKRRQEFQISRKKGGKIVLLWMAQSPLTITKLRCPLLVGSKLMSDYRLVGAD